MAGFRNRVSVPCNDTTLWVRTQSEVMRTYLAPIGYNSTSVTRVVLSHGLDTGDRVVLLRPEAESDGSRATEAIQDVERMLGEVEPEVELTVERITHDDYATALLECSEVLRDADGERVVNLGGGARDILLPFTTVALAHASELHTVLFFSDIDGKVREWELPALTASPQEPAWETLETIDELGGRTTIPELTDATGNSKSTVTRHVDDLDTNRLVETQREGKLKRVTIRRGGRLLLNTRT